MKYDIRKKKTILKHKPFILMTIVIETLNVINIRWYFNFEKTNLNIIIWYVIMLSLAAIYYNTPEFIRKYDEKEWKNTAYKIHVFLTVHIMLYFVIR